MNELGDLQRLLALPNQPQRVFGLPDGRFAIEVPRITNDSELPPNAGIADYERIVVSRAGLLAVQEYFARRPRHSKYKHQTYSYKRRPK